MRRFYIGSNGYITFGQGDDQNGESLPTISPGSASRPCSTI